MAWREAKEKDAQTLPKELKYGIGIAGVLPGEEAVFDQMAEYHVEASKGIELYTWKEAVAQEEIAPILEGLLKSEFFPKASNYFSATGQAHFRSGVVVYVQPTLTETGELATEKLALDAAVSSGSSADVVIVIAKEGAKLGMTSALSGGDGKCVFARTFVVLTERDAHVSVIQRSAANGTMLLSSRGIIAAHSSCVWSEVFSANAAIKSETDDQLVGEGAHAEILQGVVGKETARYDIFSSATHRASHTHSRIKAAGIADGESKTVYRGLIDMKKGVSAVDGAQEARFLVLSEKATVDAIPSLDIASKDVQCTHKLSIAHIRDTDTFYPKLRGLSDEESQRIFLEGHFAQVFSENTALMSEISNNLDHTSPALVPTDSAT